MKSRILSGGLGVVLGMLLGGVACDPTEECEDPMGCGVHPIGSWPTPELGDEACDGVDNDTDGLVDEGCPCDDGPERECVMVDSEGDCRSGVQRCEEGGWGGCGDLGGVPVEQTEPAVSLVGDPGLWPQGPGEVWLRFLVTPLCAGVWPAVLTLKVATAVPEMSVTYILEAGDAGVFEVELVNPFGPGAAEGPVQVSAEALIDERGVGVSESLEREEGP